MQLSSLMNRERGKKTLIQEITSGTTVTTYVGISAMGMDKTLPRWQIMRVVEVTTTDNVDTEITYASGTDKYQHVWNDRATLSYS